MWKAWKHMTMAEKALLCAVVVAAIALVVWGSLALYKKYRKQRESYLAAGALDHLDSLDSRYELIGAPEAAVPMEHFADIVDGGDQRKIEEEIKENKGNALVERLEHIGDASSLPMTASHLPMFNVDAANPSIYSFSIQAPRVLLKNKCYMLADIFRGDIPIKYHPNVPMVGKSSNSSRDSVRYDGMFSETFDHSYNKLTGRAYKNMPLKVATQATTADYVPDH